MRQATIPRRFATVSLDGFREITPELAQARAAVAAWCDNATEHIAAGHGLVIVGAVGVGKTHLAVCALRAAIDTGFSGRFLGTRDYLRELRASYGTDSADVDPLRHARGWQLLLVDDLGSARLDRNPEHVREAILDLVDGRYMDQRPVIVTANRSMAKLREDLDERITSRLEECCQIVVMQGEDYRAPQRG